MRLPEVLPLSRTRLGPVRAPQASPHAGRLEELRDFGPNPGALRMFVHIPENLPKDAPLVVILHGCGQTAAGYDQGTGWSALADRLGFAVLAPEQQTANNMGGCFNWFQPTDTTRDSGEAASIRQMIARLTADYPLDPKRIFITGLSAGGAMTAAMLACYPEIFAGGAIIAGLPYRAASNVSEALNAMRRAPQHSAREWGKAVRNASPHAGTWPILSVWHGDADNTVHAGNAEALIGQWSGLHGLKIQPSEVEQGTGYTRRIWRGDDGAVVMESHTIAGMGHGVPIQSAAEGGGHAAPYFIEAGLSATLHLAALWGLKRALPHTIVKEAVLKRLKPVLAMPEDNMPVKQVEEIPPRIVSVPPPPLKGEGLHGVIVKALKAAGLIKLR
jgi:poly(hydroxyalkanoate) depolymerase family esterase